MSWQRTTIIAAVILAVAIVWAGGGTIAPIESGVVYQKLGIFVRACVPKGTDIDPDLVCSWWR